MYTRENSDDEGTNGTLKKLQYICSFDKVFVKPEQ